ncbi:MAG: acetate kinase, partial [Candidatus Omnitrophica bacterium]|nr:acetate kinase [Candidatus Omnitrophota bacterium]
MKILVINSGSSSIKYRLFDTKKSAILSKGVIERIGTKAGPPNHYEAMKKIFNIIDSSQIQAIGHRVVHGNELFTQPTIINNKVFNVIKKYADLAPLHNPPAILGIDACRKFLKHIPQVAVFDTAFHQTMPEHAFIYGIPYKFYKKYALRRYGFHGTSHMYVAHEAARILKKPIKSLKLITCHLGNGSSVTAVKHGKSIDTSMGFTPLEGVMMGTRCGDVDVASILYLMEKEHLSVKETDRMLNKESGLLGLSGVSNDMRDIRKEALSGNKRAKLAIDIFIYRIAKYVGAYTAAMDGVDAVVLTAGIGENFKFLRQKLAVSLKNILNK